MARNLINEFDRDVHCVLGLPFDAVNVSQVVEKIHTSIANGRPCFFSTPNVNWVVACLQDEAQRESVMRSDLSLADGMPLIWVARFLGIPLPQRVAGSAIFDNLRHNKSIRSNVYFFGGPDGVAKVACEKINAEKSSMQCVGFESPGFLNVEQISTQTIISKINKSGADFLIIALGAKKGQQWIEKNRARLSAPVISHLGAVVNFVAGTVDEAPHWMRVAGLEWLWRIREEPALWQRYFSDGLIFLRLIVTRVLPHAFHLLLKSIEKSDMISPNIESVAHMDTFEIKFRGNWSNCDLSQVRETFNRAYMSRLHIRLELAAVTNIDSAFLGQVQILKGCCSRQHCDVKIIRPSSDVRRLLRYYCSEYLL